MKRMLMTLGLSLAVVAAAFAQKPMDQQSEKNVQITQGPNITAITGTSATINWTTNSAAANHVRYRVAGTGAWKSAFNPGGGTNHSLQLTGLEPGKTYEWQILTRDGDLRTSGQFQSAGTATGTAPDVNAGAAPGAAAPAPGAAAGSKVPLFRALNTASTNGSHLFSTNAGDQSARGMRPVGSGCYMMILQTSSTVPVYRLVNPNGDNVLTTDVGEKASLAGRGYTDQGVIGYISSAQVGGTDPFYKLVSANGATHFYTASPVERAQVLGQGWKDQGTLGYIWNQP